MPKKRQPTSDAIEIMHRRYFEGQPEQLAALEEARANDEVARKIYQIRTQAGLSQRQLAELVGTTASVICRLEDADYEGHSLPMLRRIAAALNRRVEIRFMPLRHKPSSPGEHGNTAFAASTQSPVWHSCFWAGIAATIYLERFFGGTSWGFESPDGESVICIRASGQELP